MLSIRSFTYAVLPVALGVLMVPSATNAASTTRATTAPSHPFTDISCPTAHDCYAVGTNPFPGSGATFIAHLTHGEWSFAQPPGRIGRHGQLDAIDCYSTSVCVAVGSTTGAQGKQLDLALRLVHGAWSPEAFPAHSNATMEDVSCAGPLRCVAVAQKPSANVGIAYERAGGHWARTRIARPIGEPAETELALTGVSCASTSHCVAVGSDLHTGGPFTATLDAGSWVASALVVPENASHTWSYGLRRISCANLGSCVAVGDRENKHGVLAPLVSALRGGVWTSSTLTRLTAGRGNLADVDCLSAQKCLAIGNQGTELLTESLHAGAWQGSVSETTPSTYWNEVSCHKSTCHAVGDRTGTTPQGHNYEDGVTRTFAYPG